jgi:hypothetical protein
MQAELCDIKRAVASGARDAGRRLKTELRRQVASVGIGRRLTQQLRRQALPKPPFCTADGLNCRAGALSAASRPPRPPPLAAWRDPRTCLLLDPGGARGSPGLLAMYPACRGCRSALQGRWVCMASTAGPRAARCSIRADPTSTSCMAAGSPGSIAGPGAPPWPHA